MALCGLIAGLLVGTGMNAEAITITTDTFTDFDMDFAEVGDITNVDDGLSGSTAYGAVSYEYRMAVNEVSEKMINDYNAAPANSSLLITKDTRGTYKPATSVSWNEAARFVNWLNTSQGYQAAYKFTNSGANDNISLWSSANAWQLGGENLYRHKDAYYFLPSEDEWYKAAFYDGSSMLYYDYATGSNTAPTAVASGTDPNTAVYNYQSDPEDFDDPGVVSYLADIDDAGGLSYYGTMAQSGNVFEWGESAFDGGNDLDSESRVLRGGRESSSSTQLQSSFRSNFNLGPGNGDSGVGFRVASVSAAVAVVPEPSSVGLLVIGAMGCVLRRKRG